MVTVSVVYHSTKGHTAALAEALARSRRHPTVTARRRSVLAGASPK